MADNPSANEVPIPPADAERSPRACRYCIVGCSYEVYKWPVGEEGGPDAEDNALGVDYPASYGNWPSPNMHQIIEEGGREYHVLFRPDPDAEVNSGSHSVRGGTQAQSLYSKHNEDFDDRLKQPQIRIGGSLTPVDWDTALEVVARVTDYATREEPNGYGMKMYAYQFVENTFAGSKLIFDVIGSPNFGFHNRPAYTPESPGVENSGLYDWSTAYDDAAAAETMVIAGGDPYENQDVYFHEYVDAGGADIIQINPRRTFTANYAENNDGLFLQVNEATDPVLLNAIARHIVDRGWHDESFLDEWVMDDRDAIDEEGWYQEEFGMTPEEYLDLLQSDDRYAPENAAEITGIDADDIRDAAERIAQPDADQTRTLFTYEKGLIWGWSHENTAAMANLALLTGSVGREGTGITRLGGHQEGWWEGGPGGEVIADHSTQTFSGERVEDVPVPPNTIERVRNGEIDHWHVIGTNPLRSEHDTQSLRNVVRERTSGTQPQTADIDEIMDAFRERIDDGGMVLTHQEIYPNSTTEYADIVLPAKAVEAGEQSNHHRWNGERRFRHYASFMEGPPNARPDWDIFADIGRRLGADDMDWESSDELFNHLAAEHGDGYPYHIEALNEKAEQDGTTASEVMRELDTDGVRLPARLEDGEIAGTPRLHTPDGDEMPGDGRFFTDSGKAILMKVDWDRIANVYESLTPDRSEDELWVTNGRVNRLWQSMYTHQRLEYISKRYEQNVLQLHPNDAEARGIEAGDLVEVVNDDVYNQYSENGTGSFTAVAYVVDDEDAVQGQVVPEGLAFTYWLYPGQVANDIVPGYLDPANPNPGYKYATGKVRRLGESDQKERMSFQPENVAPDW